VNPNDKGSKLLRNVRTHLTNCTASQSEACILHTLSLFENRALQTTAGSNSSEEKNGSNCITTSFVICVLHHAILRWPQQDNEISEACCTNGTDWKHIEGFRRKTWRDRDDWKGY